MLSDKIETAKNKYRQFKEDQELWGIKEENQSSNYLEKEPVLQNRESKIRAL